MNLFHQLMGVKAPGEDMTLTSAELSFRPFLPMWLAIVLFAIGVLWAFLLYIREKGTIGWIRKILGALLRTTVIGIVLFLLSRPYLLVEFEGKYDRNVIMLFDNSQSLKQVDRRISPEAKARVLIARNELDAEAGLDSDTAKKAITAHYKEDVSRLDTLAAALKHPKFKLVEGLGDRGPVQPYLFGVRLHGLPEAKPGDKKPLAEQIGRSLEANEAKSKLADAILELLQRKDGELPAALVVFTDGLDFHSKAKLPEVALECRRLNVPLHVVGVGASIGAGSGEAGLLRLKQPQVDETIFAEDTLTIPLHYQAQGLDKGMLEISLSIGGKEIKLKRDKKEVDKLEIPAGSGDDLRQDLTFAVPKAEPGGDFKDLVVTIGLKGDKKYQDSFKTKVQIVEDKIKVLYIENSPGFQYKFLQQMMLRDKRLDPWFLLVNADKEVARSGKPYLAEFPKTKKEFIEAKYHVIILGDVAPAGPKRPEDKAVLNKEQMEWIKEFTQKRGGLIAVAGRQHMPVAYAGTPLEEVLPIKMGPAPKPRDLDVRTVEYPATPSEIGLRRTGVLGLADDLEENAKIWQGLPGFHSFYPIEELRAGAESLLINPRAKMGDEPMPILVTHYYSDLGQVMFLGTDETWRWRYNVEDKHFSRFWGQILVELGKPSLNVAAKKVTMELSGAQAIVDEETRIFARLLDNTFAVIKEKEVDGQLRFLDAPEGKGATRPIKLLRQPDGRFMASFTPDRPGKFEITITNPEPTAFVFVANADPRHELAPSGLNEKALKDLAELSGGRFYREEDLRYLVNAVESKHVTFTRRQEVLLWNWLIFVLFLLVITGEWLLRKFSNLS